MVMTGQQDRRGQLQKLFDRASLSFRLLLDRRVDAGYKLIPFLGVLYVLSPIDLMPELLLGPLGVFDDIGVVVLALETFIRMAPTNVVDEHRNHLGGEATGQNEDIIEGNYKRKR